MKHTPGPWHTVNTARAVVRAGPPRDWRTVSSVSDPDDPQRKTPIETANAHLIALAPTAPHECDPDCPGDIIRRKLELYEEMVETLWSTCGHHEALGHDPEAQRCDGCDILAAPLALLARAKEIEG